MDRWTFGNSTLCLMDACVKTGGVMSGNSISILVVTCDRWGTKVLVVPSRTDWLVSASTSHLQLWSSKSECDCRKSAHNKGWDTSTKEMFQYRSIGILEGKECVFLIYFDRTLVGCQ